jgi:hypothetical protein
MCLGLELSSDAVKGLLVRLAPAVAERSRVDRWQAGVGNQGRPERVIGRPRACLRMDLSPGLPAPARPTEPLA